jgi:outer membrane protein assembly factor BamB
VRRPWCLGWIGAAALCGAVACESVGRGAGPEAPLSIHRPNGAISVVYSRELVAPTRRQGEPYERGRAAIDPHRRRLFVGSSDGGLYALRAEDGTTLWRFETLGPVQAEPLYDPLEDVVYFGSNDGALYKVAASDGHLMWRVATNAEVSRQPKLSGRSLYVVNANDTVLALNTADGSITWTQHRTPAAGMSIAGHAGLLLQGERLYAAFSDGAVVAYDTRTGNERWQPVDLGADSERVLGEPPKYLDVDTTPVPGVAQGVPVVYVASYEGGVYALDADTGVEIWAQHAARGASELLDWSEPAHRARDGQGDVPARNLLIAATGTTGLWALDPETGAEVWRQTVPRGGVSAPVAIAGALLISTSQLGVFLVSPLDGHVMDGVHMVNGAAMTPAALGRRAFLLSNGGRLLSLTVTPPPG